MLDLSNVWPEWKAVEKIGEGSFGKVYRCEREEYGIKSVCAIKVISVPLNQSELESMRSEGLSDSELKEVYKEIVHDFLNEIKLMEMLKGAPNIVNVEGFKIIEREHEIGWDIYIRMEYLNEFIGYFGNKTVTESDVKAMASDICNALNICAENGIIHRDVKPANIFLDRFGSFKLGDFGIAKRFDNLPNGLSRKGAMIYIAPEVYREETYDYRADIFSLGRIMYKLLNRNREPFVNMDSPFVSFKERSEAIMRIFKGDKIPAPIDASPEMAAVILKACEFKPEDRFANAAEFKAAIDSVPDLKAFDDEATMFANDYFERTVAARDFEIMSAMLKNQAEENAFTYRADDISEQPTQAAYRNEEATVLAVDEPTVFDIGNDATVICRDEPTVVSNNLVETAIVPEKTEKKRKKKTSKVKEKAEKKDKTKKKKVKEKLPESVEKAMTLVRNGKIYKWSIFALAIVTVLIASASFRSIIYFAEISEVYSYAENLLWNCCEGTLQKHDFELFFTGILYDIALIVWFVFIVKNKPVFSTVLMFITAGCYALNSFVVYDARYYSGYLSCEFHREDIGYRLFYSISYDLDFAVFWVLMALAFVIQMTGLITWAVEKKKGNDLSGYSVSIPKRVSKYLAGILLITAVALVVLFTLILG